MPIPPQPRSSPPREWRRGGGRARMGAYCPWQLSMTRSLLGAIPSQRRSNVGWHFHAPWGEPTNILEWGIKRGMRISKKAVLSAFFLRRQGMNLLVSSVQLVTAPSAVDEIAALFMFTIAIRIRMQAALALAMRDVARNSFRI